MKKKTLRRTLALLAILILPTVPAHAAGRNLIKLGTAAPDGSVWHRGLQEMAETWKERSGGAVTLRVYAGSVAGDESDMVRKMRLGQLQAGSISIIGLSAIDKAFDVFTIPMFYESYEELFYVMDALEPIMVERLQGRGFVFLGWGLGGWAHLFTKKPVRTVDDIRQMKMFVSAGDDPWVQYWKNNGFRPVPLAVTDIMTGLQTGLIDGLTTTPLAALMLQWYRHAPYMIDIDLAPLIGATIVTDQAWAKVDEKSREPLIASARELEELLKREIPAKDDEAVEEMAKRGLTVMPPEEVGEQVDSWRELAAELALHMRETMVPADVYDLAVKAQAEYRLGAGR
jgi:TRAP-type C4-dicarboxylate transport system substrate-binding protein